MIEQGRSFEEWADTLSKEHRQVLYEHGPIPNLIQIYFILLDNIMNKKKDCNPTTLEIIGWIEMGKISEEKTIHRKSLQKHRKENSTHEKSMIVVPLQLLV